MPEASPGSATNKRRVSGRPFTPVLVVMLPTGETILLLLFDAASG